TKNTQATMNSAAKPTRPSTPAPADALLIASVALLTTGMNSDESSALSWFRFAIDWAFLEIALLRVHSLEVGRVIGNRGLGREAGRGDQRGDHGHQRQPASEQAAAIDDRFGKELRQPREPGADRARRPGLGIGGLGQDPGRDLVQARRASSRGQRVGVPGP